MITEQIIFVWCFRLNVTAAQAGKEVFILCQIGGVEEEEEMR